MGRWDFTTFVRTKSFENFERALECVLAVDGYVPIRDGQYDARRLRGWCIQTSGSFPDLLGFAWIEGPNKWSVLKTSPADFLLGQPQRMVTPRLATLSRILNVPSISLNIVDACGPYILECSAAGDSLSRGIPMWEFNVHVDIDSERFPRGQGDLLDDCTTWNPFVLSPYLNDEIDDESEAISDDDIDQIAVGEALSGLSSENWPHFGPTEAHARSSSDESDGTPKVLVFARRGEGQKEPFE